MAVQIESPTLGRGNDWNSFYGTEPFQGNDPFSPSAFGTLLFSQPDAASALDLLGAMPSGSLTFADIGGTIAIDQLPPGSLVTVDSIGEDGLYFFDDSSGLPSLINPDSTVSFISQHIGFSDLSGIISIDQFPPGTVVSVDSINEDAVYFFDNTLGLPKLINATDLSDFVGLNNLTFADIGGTVGLDQFPPGSVAALDSIDEDALYFFDNTLFAPKLINAADTLTFLGITGGGGSFLASNTARVDPSGNDSTGTIGDLGKPFLTVQAAIDAFEALVSPPSAALIDIGNNSFLEDLTTSLHNISFVGTSEANSYAFSSLHFTAVTGQIFLGQYYCSTDGITSDSDGRLFIGVENGSVGSITAAADVLLASDTGAARQDLGITAAGNIVTQGVYLYNSTLSAPGFDIRVENARPVYALADGSYNGIPTIDSAGSEVWITGSVIQEITAAGTLHLIDSRVVSTNNATSTVYADVLLLPRYQMSVDFDAAAGLKLLNDSATPGNSKYYGTNSGGTKGYFALPIAGSGDVVGPSSSVDSEIALFNSTTGKLIKRATGSGLAVLTSGVLSTTTNNSSNWDTAFTERAQWNGGATNLVAATGRTSLGLGTLSTQNGTFSGTSSGTNTGDQTITLTGDVTGGGTGSFSATLGNIPTAVTMAGYLAATAIAAPGTPAAGIGRIYVDSTSKNLAVKDDAGIIKHGVQTKASATSNFLTAISDAGVVSAAQPADSDISFTDITTGNATTSQHGFVPKFPGGTTNFLRADGTFAAPSGGGDALTTNPLSQFAATTSVQLAGVISDETGTGLLVFGSNPTITTPTISTLGSAAGTALNLNGTISAAGASSIAGTAANLTASAAIAATTNVGAAAGGAVVLTSGNAARLTSGNANGGNITLIPGTGIGTGVSGVVEQRNSTNAQAFNVYNTFTDVSNYEYGSASWSSNILNIGTFAAGTGTARNLQLNYAGSLTGPAIKIQGQTTRVSIGASSSATQAYSSGVINIIDGTNFTPTSGTNVMMDVTGNGAPTATSTMVFVPVRIKPTINYSAGTPGAGNYEALKIAVTETALPTGTNYLIRASAGSGGSTDKFAVTNAGLASVYNGITTAGVGNPYLVAAGRVTAQSAANASISTYTTPAVDGSYEVSMNMNVTAATALSTSLNCNYTDESNTARTMIFPVTGLTGSFLAGGLVTATGAFETPVMHIRCKASTAITLYTATGTFTSVTYTAEGNIIQTK